MHIILQASEFSFTYSVQSERDTIVDGKWDEDLEDQMEALRTVIVISADKLPTVIEHIKTELASSWINCFNISTVLFSYYTSERITETWHLHY